MAYLEGSIVRFGFVFGGVDDDDDGIRGLASSVVVVVPEASAICGLADAGSV